MDVISYLKSASNDELQKIQDFLLEEIKSRRSAPQRIRRVTTYSDGASRGNPGHAGIGILIYDEKDQKIVQDFNYIGQCTNNEAEYRALLLALDRAFEITQGHVECVMDSELLVRQLNGQYAIKSEKLIKFYQEVKERVKNFSSVSFRHVLRSEPHLQLADQLANKGIDEAMPKAG